MNAVVAEIADENYRSQSDLIDGLVHNMSNALPNASFVGFTGTPLMAGDKVTRHVFGEYAELWDTISLSQSIRSQTGTGG